MSENRDLGKAPISSLLISMSVHSSIALLLYSIYGLTDTIFLSWGVNAYAAGAVAVVQPLMMLLSAVSTTVGAGGASLISRALGRKDMEAVSHIIANAFLFFWFFSISVTVVGLIFLDPLIHIFGAEGELFEYAKEYARIILIGAITSTAFSALIRAEGNTKFSMYLWVFPVLINILLDYVFIFPLGMGAGGAALATVCAQISSCLMSLWFFFVRKSRLYVIRAHHFKLNFKILSKVFVIGFPAFVNQISSGVLTVIINRLLGSAGGANAITAFGFATKVHTIAMLPQEGIVQGAQPLIGYNYGQKNGVRTKKTMQVGIRYSFVYGVCVTILVIVLRVPLITLFTKEIGIIALGATILIYLLADLPIRGIRSLIATYFQSIGDAKRALALPLIGICIVQIPLITLLGKLFGLKGILWAFPLSSLLTFVLSIMMGRKALNK